MSSTPMTEADVQPMSAPVAVEPMANVATITPEPPASTPVEQRPQPEPKLPSQSAPQRYCHTNDLWIAMDEAVVGLSHRAKNLPCQDAAQAVNRPRPMVVVADGAGSSAVSEIGARAVVSGTIRLLDTLEKQMAELLDSNDPCPEAPARTLGLLLVKHAIGLLKDLATEHRREMRDFRCTFLVMVVGKTRLLWVKVGDGALVIEKMKVLTTPNEPLQQLQAELSSLGELGKGEFANQTQFLDAITPTEVQVGLLESKEITGIAVMSDGAAERLVSNDGYRVAPRVSTLLQQLREDKLRRQALTQMFYEEVFCKGTTGDDRSIALAACGVVAPEPIPSPKTGQIDALSASAMLTSQPTHTQTAATQAIGKMKPSGLAPVKQHASGHRKKKH